MTSHPVKSTSSGNILLVIVPSLTGKQSDWDYLIKQVALAGGAELTLEPWAPSASDEHRPIVILEHLRKQLEALHNRHIHCLYFDYPRGIQSQQSARNISISLNARIHEKWVFNGGYDNVVLVGHSFGGLIAKQAYLFGLGRDKTASEKLPWAKKVNRVVLFAAINRGFDPATNWPVWLFSRLPLWFKWFERFLLVDGLRGSDFICNLSIEWIREFSDEKHGIDVIQLLGDKDSYVKRDDSLDIEQFPLGYLLTIPDAQHSDLHKLADVRDPQGRLALLAMAIFGALNGFAENRVILEKRVTSPKRVVFLVHGIRAANYDWPALIEDKIRAMSVGNIVVETRKPTYGYFSALRFAFPYTRRKNLAWFKDEYRQSLAMNPDAHFHFIGHSNGTYILGHNLTAVPGMRFKRVALLGSVLPSEYDWASPLNRGQVESVRNERACDDVPVGFLCSGLRGIGMKDVGTGGVQGFYQDHPRKVELFWYQGGHSAVFEDTNAIESLAAYALEEIDATQSYLCQPANYSPDNQPSDVFTFLSRTARIPVLGLVIVLVTWVFYILALVFGWDIPSVSQILAWATTESRSREIATHLTGLSALLIGLNYL